MRSIALCAVWAVFLGAGTTAFADLPEKKVIHCSIEMLSARWIRENIDRMQRIPFDGISVNPYLLDERGEPHYTLFRVLGRERHELETFRPVLEDIKATRWGRYQTNFFHTWVQGGWDWFDDNFSEVCVHNWTVAARIAREGGLRGLIVDPEQYHGPVWDYWRLPRRQEHTAQEYAQKVYERGREVMRAVNKIYPDIHILMFFGPSASGVPRNPESRAYPQGTYGLLGYFVDGMLAECLPGAKIIDGYEHAYGFRTRIAYEEAARFIREKCKSASLAADKWDQHLSVGFALWMDLGDRQQPFDLENFENNFYTPEAFKHALAAALAATEEYVWVWHERVNWFTGRNLPPAYLEAFYAAREPGAAEEPVPWPKSAAVPATAASLKGHSEEETFAPWRASYEFLWRLPAEWKFRLDEHKEGLKGEWFLPNRGQEAWPSIRIGEFWEPQGYLYDGYAWYWLETEVPPLPADRRLYLLFGAVDESAWVWINGRLAGENDSDETTWDKPYALDVTDLLRPGQRNTFAVRVLDRRYAGGIWKPVWLIGSKERRQ